MLKPRADAITLKQLRTLREVAERRSLTVAAGALGLSVPAVHAQLRALTAQMGAELVERGADGGWSPTREGEVVLAASRAVQSALDVCAERVAALRAGSAGRVTLGVVSTAKYWAPSLVSRLARALPEIEILLRVGNREDTIGALAEGRIDLVIMGRPPREPPTTAYAIGPHPHCIIAPRDHRLAGLERVEPEALFAETFLSREEGSGTRTLMIQFLDGIGEGRAYRSVEMGTNETIKQAVMAGLGIAMISTHTCTEELRQGRLVALAVEGLPLVRRWFLLHERDRPLLPAARTVLHAIEAMEGSFLPS